MSISCLLVSSPIQSPQKTKNRLQRYFVLPLECSLAQLCMADLLSVLAFIEMSSFNCVRQHRRCPIPSFLFFSFLSWPRARAPSVLASVHTFHSGLLGRRSSLISHLWAASGLFLTSGGEACRHTERQGAAPPAAAAGAADPAAQQRLHLGEPGWPGDPHTTVFGCKCCSRTPTVFSTLFFLWAVGALLLRPS